MEVTFFSDVKRRAVESLHAWLRGSGEAALNAWAGVFLWGGALHAAYLLVMPAPLRAQAARRNAPLAMRASLAALVGAGAYDTLQNRRLESERAALAAEYRRLTRAAADASGPEGAAGPGAAGARGAGAEGAGAHGGGDDDDAT